jgi:hypothetical protein
VQCDEIFSSSARDFGSIANAIAAFRIFDLRIDDRLRFVAERVSSLRVFQFDDGDDISGLCFVDLVEHLARDDVQSAKPLR